MNTFADRSTEMGLHWDAIWKEICPVSELGIQYKKKVQPYLPGQEHEWEAEMDLLSRMSQDTSRIQQCKKSLKEIKNISRIVELFQSGYSGNASDWFVFKQFLIGSFALYGHMHNWKRELKETENFLYSMVLKLNNGEKIDRSFTLDDLQDARLRVLRQQKNELESSLRATRMEWEIRIKDELQLQWQSTPFFISNYDEQSKQALSNHPYIAKVTETPFEIGYELLPSAEIKQMEGQLEQVEDQIEEKERMLLSNLHQQFLPYLPTIIKIHEEIGLWDWRIAKVEWSIKVCAVKPSYNDERTIVLEGGRHPYIELVLQRKNQSFVPVTMEMKQGVTTIVGPNMGGKSVALKTIAISVMLFQYGLWVPATSFSGYFFPNVILVKGDEEQVENGLSSFGAEVSKVAEALKQTDSFLLFDEVARGTNPEEGSRLVRALVEYLQINAYVCLIVTHFSNVLHVSGIRSYRLRGLTEKGIEKLKVDYKEALKQGIDYRLELVQERKVPQQALLIAEALGMPIEIIERAKKEENNG